MGFTLNDALNPPLSRVQKSTDGVIITVYGRGGLGKTPVGVKMERPFYVAVGKSGLSGINNVAYAPVRSWKDFREFVKVFGDKKNFDVLHKQYQTLVLDEMEVLYSYCEEYIKSAEGVTKIKEANSGWGAWGELRTEWETQIMKIISSGFCVMFILHTAQDENGKNFPVGDTKRMLPILINHSEIIGYVRSNGVDAETGRPIHSSLMLADSPECFARTRNEYFDPIIEDYTADNLIKAYYDAIDRQEKAEGVTAISREERDAMFETEKRNFEDVMNEVGEVGTQIVEKFGSKEKITEIVENVLGKGALVSNCTPKQQEAVEVILSDMKDLLNEK